MNDNSQSKWKSFLARHKWLSPFVSAVICLLIILSVISPPRQVVDMKAIKLTMDAVKSAEEAERQMILRAELATERNLSLDPHIPISDKHIAGNPPRSPVKHPSGGHYGAIPKPGPRSPSKPPPPNGMIDYTAPHEVKFPEKFNVDVALTRFPPKVIPLAPRTKSEKNALGLSSENPMTNQPIEVTQLMDVQLSSLDPGAFNVVATDAKPKQLPENGHAEWHWVVTPNQTGEKHLRLHWQSIQILSNGTLAPPEDLGTAYATITVNVEPFNKRIIPESKKLISENWKAILKYFLPSSGFVLLVWVWAKLRGKKAPSLLPKEGEEKKEEEGKDEETD